MKKGVAALYIEGISGKSVGTFNEPGAECGEGTGEKTIEKSRRNNWSSSGGQIISGKLNRVGYSAWNRGNKLEKNDRLKKGNSKGAVLLKDHWPGQHLVLLRVAKSLKAVKKKRKKKKRQ